MRSSGGADVLSQRVARHGFAERPATTVAQAAALTGGLQAQDPLASRLGVRSRAQGLTETDVLRAIEDRSVVRTWLMRATIHLVPAEDVGWMTRLLGPGIARGFAKRWLNLGLTDDLLESAFAALPDVLAAGPLTRREVVAALAEREVVIGTADQASTHVLLYASTLGLLCRGPERGRDNTFALLADWVPGSASGPAGDDALAELARRYFRAFSPATAADFTTWSGLASGRAIALIRDELTSVEVNGRAGYTLGKVAPQRGLRLLSAFDNYLVGYRDRELIIDAAHYPRVYQGGMIRPTALLDGQVIGTWRLVRKAKAATVGFTPFGDLNRKSRTAIEAEVDDIGRFIDLPTALVISSPAS
ncbi:MAG: winged helix DNA-binding domain-containing protein [Pseudonocardiales bacterium]